MSFTDLLELASTTALASHNSNGNVPLASPSGKEQDTNGHSLDSTHSRTNGGAYPPVGVLNDSDPTSSATAVKRRNAEPSTTRLTQFQVLSQREYLNLKRDWSLIVMHNAVACLVGLFVGGLYWKVDTTISGFQVSLFSCAGLI